MRTKDTHSGLSSKINQQRKKCLSAQEIPLYENNSSKMDKLQSSICILRKGQAVDVFVPFS